MKQIMLVFLLAFSGLCFAQDSLGVDAKIEQLLKLSGAEDQFLGAIDNMLDMQQQQMGNTAIPAEWWTEFRDEIHRDGWNQIVPKLVGVYRDNLTEEEIDYQIAYLADPMSQQIIAKQGAIMQQSMLVGQEWGQALSMKIMTDIQERKENKD